MPQPSDLEPAGLLADAAAGAAAEHALDVDLGRRLGEGEVRRPEAHAEVALEELLHELVQHGLEVREAHALVDQQAFDLVEHRRVRHVGVAAIDAARHDHAQRRLLAQHGAHLHRRGVRAQQRGRRGNRRCRASPAPDGWRDVERLEVVPVVLDLGAVLDREARARGTAPRCAGACGVTGCRPPGCWPRPGSVTSMRPAASLRSSSARSSSSLRASSTAPISSRTALMRAPAALRSSGASAPSDFSCAVIAPFLPNSSTLSASSSTRLAHSAARDRPLAARSSRLGLVVVSLIGRCIRRGCCN